MKSQVLLQDCMLRTFLFLSSFAIFLSSVLASSRVLTFPFYCGFVKFDCRVKCSVIVALSKSCHFPACLKRSGSVERMLLSPARPLHILPHSLPGLEGVESPGRQVIISLILLGTGTFQKRSLPKPHKGECRLKD